jgi:thiamine kinase-like enzyme
MHRQLVAITTEKIEKKAILSKMLADLKKETVDELCNKNLLIELLTIKIFHSNKFKELTGGFSSNTYHYEERNLVLRFPKPRNPLYRHACIEIHNLSEAKLFELTSIKIIGYYTKYSLLVTEFIPSFQAYSEKDFKQTEKLIALAHLIKKLHYSQASFKKNPEASLCFIDSSTKTFQTIKSVLSEEDYKILHKLDAIRCCLAKFNIIKRPAHGDLHHFNLVEINGKMQLMDWELSTLEDPALDISRFFCVSDLNNEQKDIFLQHYKSSLNIPLSEATITSLATRVKLFEPLNYFSIVVWAKYAILFAYSNKRNLLDVTIKNFTEKTLNTIEKIDLATIKPKSNLENNVSYPNSYFSLFKLTSELEPTKEQEKKLFKYRKTSGII